MRHEDASREGTMRAERRADKARMKEHAERVLPGDPDARKKADNLVTRSGPYGNRRRCWGEAPFQELRADAAERADPGLDPEELDLDLGSDPEEDEPVP